MLQHYVYKRTITSCKHSKKEIVWVFYLVLASSGWWLILYWCDQNRSDTLPIASPPLSLSLTPKPTPGSSPLLGNSMEGTSSRTPTVPPTRCSDSSGTRTPRPVPISRCVHAFLLLHFFKISGFGEPEIMIFEVCSWYSDYLYLGQW
jgi:hypothetical protein